MKEEENKMIKTDNVLLHNWRRLWESQMLRGMLLQIFGLPSSLELPENWQNSLKGNSTKIEFKEIRGERLSSLDFLCKGIALCLEGNYTPAINAFENSAEREPYKVEAWVGKALSLTILATMNPPWMQ